MLQTHTSWYCLSLLKFYFVFIYIYIYFFFKNINKQSLALHETPKNRKTFFTFLLRYTLFKYFFLKKFQEQGSPEVENRKP
jgi:hypothetical protein